MIYIVLILLILCIILFLFCIYLYNKEKNTQEKLNKLIIELEIQERSKNINAIQSLSQNKISITDISKEIDEAILNNYTKKNPYKKEEKSIIKDETLYQKNILDSSPHNLSSINILNDNIIKKNKKRKEVVNMNEHETQMNLNDFIKKNNISSEIDSSKKQPIKSNISFIEELSKSLESYLDEGPQTIELTDYEKEQEESAIISYKEFLRVKDQLYEINEAKENQEFINELKSFRNNLN